ncbi:hypothetical protein GQ42DRAFT_123403, partial [Ramicandelaber brevisporus]
MGGKPRGPPKSSARLEQQREIHNATERQRRTHLNNDFKELASLIPTLDKARRPSKRKIVQEAVKYLRTVNE